MHEMSIAVQIIESAVGSIPDTLKGQPVSRITLDIGKMAGIVVDSLRFGFEIAAKGTALENAELVINEIPLTVICDSCNTTFELSEPDFWCRTCKDTPVRILTGREMVIRSLDIIES
jgi:hydrogenase nickel incorporation protein HypA/HybF